MKRVIATLDQSIARLNEFGLPNTLLHGDIHSGNAIANTTSDPSGNTACGASGNGNSFWYIDWTDAAVGHPFVDMFTIRITRGARGASSSATRTSMNGGKPGRTDLLPRGMQPASPSPRITPSAIPRSSAPSTADRTGVVE